MVHCMIDDKKNFLKSLDLYGRSPVIFRLSSSQPWFGLGERGEKLSEFRSFSDAKLHSRVFDRDRNIIVYDIFEAINDFVHPIARYRAKWKGVRVLSAEEKEKIIYYNNGGISLSLAKYDYAIDYGPPSSHIMIY